MKFRHLFSLRKADDNTRVYESDGVFMRIDFIENMLRVALIRNMDLLPTFSINPDRKMTNEGRSKLSLEGFDLCSPEVHEDENTIRFSHCGLDFNIELLNFRMTVRNDKGILYQDRSGLAYNFDGELGDGSVQHQATACPGSSRQITSDS